MGKAKGGRELKIGIIGYGGRVSGMARQMRAADPGFKIAAIADPRMDEIRAREGEKLAGCAFFKNADAMLASGKLDGVMIGTRCHLHSAMACKVAPLNVPLFLEKPVGINYRDLRNLKKAFKSVTAPVVVSFPLRVSPIVIKIKEIIRSGRLGRVDHVIAVNDVPYGEVYFAGWYRNYHEVGGLFLQKATHDLDYITFLLGEDPKRVCAMKTQRVWGGRKPHGLMCKNCGEKRTCPESPFNPRGILTARERKVWREHRRCLFSREIRNEDSGNCLVEYESGVQVSYTQNFFARHKAARRGARLFCYKGTIEFDWYENRLRIFRHDRPEIEDVKLPGGASHFGGDDELVKDFLAVLRRRKPSRTPLSAGIMSALLCLKARESAEKGTFCAIKLPG